MYKNILVVGAEKHSLGLDFTTRGRDISVIFGDGAGAVVSRRPYATHKKGRLVLWEDQKKAFALFNRVGLCPTVESCRALDKAGSFVPKVFGIGFCVSAFVCFVPQKVRCLTWWMDIVYRFT